MIRKKSHSYVNNINAIPKDTKFIAMIDDSYSAMGDDYGPPDPPPQMETHHLIQIITFDSEESLLEWIKFNTASRSPKNVKVLPYSPVNISTEIKISISWL